MADVVWWSTRTYKCPAPFYTQPSLSPCGKVVLFYADKWDANCWFKFCRRLRACLARTNIQRCHVENLCFEPAVGYFGQMLWWWINRSFLAMDTWRQLLVLASSRMALHICLSSEKQPPHELQHISSKF